MIVGIDPGPKTCGVVWLDAQAMRVARAETWSVEALAYLLAGGTQKSHAVAIERVQACGISGAALLETSEVVGRLWQAALCGGVPPERVHRIYRRTVIGREGLDCTGRGNRDALVRQRLLEVFAERHGLAVEAVVGRKAAPGPMFGVTNSHTRAALAVAYVASLEAS